MAIFTFSTKTTRPGDTSIIHRVKKQCDVRGINFSALVVRLIIEWEANNDSDNRAAEVHSNK